jgi:hypothetical protein
MREDTGPVRWVGQQAVVALPVAMGASNAGQIREELLPVINGGARVLTAGMTATASCDHVGADAVVRALKRAVISSTGLVGTAGHVPRVLGLSGPGHLVSRGPSLEAAMAASPPAEVLAGPGRGGSRSSGGSTVGYGR